MRRTLRRCFTRLFVQPLEDRCVPSAALDPEAWGPIRFADPHVQVPAFRDLKTIPANVLALTPALAITDMRTVSIDQPALTTLLSAAPKETLGAAVQDSITLTLPTPDGKAARFKVWQVSYMEPSLAAKLPDFKTYRGVGIDDPAADIAADITAQGFHASVRSPDGSWYVDPYYNMSQSVYAVYDRADQIVPQGTDFSCDVCPAAEDAGKTPGVSLKSPQTSPGGPTNNLFVNGTTLRTFRLAVAATTEYTTKMGGTIAKAQAAIALAVTRVNQIFESELAVRFVQVDNTDIVFDSTTTDDDFTNGDKDALIYQSQKIITDVIHAENYDIGEVFDCLSPGLGQGGRFIGKVGIDTTKAQGCSLGEDPVMTNLGFENVVLHELGHGLGASHTFSASGDPTTEHGKNLNNQYEPGHGYEPGYGSTLMSYANYDFGSNNYATKLATYFHTHNLDLITNFINDTIPNIGTKQSTNNSPPTILALSEYSIPANTPFVLSGTGIDPNGNPLTYTWEQFDKAQAQTNLGTPDSGSGPLFRTFEPSATGNVRSFPAFETVLAGKTGSATEVAITTTRDLNFRLTARDGQGAYYSAPTVIHAFNIGSGFAITNFNTAQKVYAGTKHTVTWNVSGTTASAFNASSVYVDLSSDGGMTFTNLATEINDGSAEITLPAGLNTTKARFRIRPINNIFYDISDADFTIKAVPPVITVYSPFSGTTVPGSLGEAIADANGGPGVQTINFDPSVFNTPFTVNFGQEMPITEAVTINGPGAGLLTLNGTGNHRLFNTDPAPANTAITFRGLTLNNGRGTDGGAVYIGDENVTFEDSTISNSSATEDGGAINIQSAGSLTMRRTTVSGNTAANDGGGIYFNVGGSVDILDSAIVNNRATSGMGGGLYFHGATGANGFLITSTTIANNSADTGGGGIMLHHFSGAINLANSTVTGNYTFDVGGGGIARNTSKYSTGNINLANSIVSGNTGPFAPDVSTSGTVNVNSSAIGSTAGFTLSGSGNLLGANLKLRPLADNGGSTPSVAFEFDSPLRDFSSSNALAVDQRGYPRNANGIDIGAFELQTTVTSASFGSGPGTLRAAIAESNRVVGTDTITFGSAFDTPQTISFVGSDANLTDAVTIVGKGESLTRISGNNTTRIFDTTGVAAGKTVTLRGLTLTAGSASASGGAILAADEYLVIEDSVISNSYAAAEGGAIFVGAGGKLTLTRSTLSGNSVGSGGLGGAIRFVNGGNSEIVASTLVGNRANQGGAIYLSGQGSTVTVLNSTLSGNSAGFGGAIAVDKFIGALTVRNTTITDNTAASRGGGLEAVDGTPNINLESTIVAGNTAPNGLDLYSNVTLTINRSAIGSNAGASFSFTGANNLPFGTDLKLGVLANNGGPTLTRLPSNDSPLVNAGSNPGSLATDQRGVSRTLFGATDIGSVETTIAPPDTSAPTIASITSTTANGTYGIGTPIGININFSEPVTLNGTLTLTLDTGAVVSISGPQTGQSFGGSFTVAAGQNSPDLNVTAIALTGGSTLRDAALNPAVLTLPISNLAVNKDIVISTPPIDNNAPTITSITSSTPNGTYAAGATISVTLNFSETVTLTGSLFVFFDSGGALIIQGPQSGSTLTGIYTVGANQNSPDLNVTAVQLDPNSSLLDAAGNPASFTLPASNLANNSNLVVGNVSTQTFTVTTTADSGAGSLRQAIADANNTAGLQTIVFDSTFNSAKTITLTGGQISITDAVNIIGPGAMLTTINGNGNRIVRTDLAAANVAITISGLTFTGANAGNGGAFFVENEVLTLTGVRVSGNSANSGAGIHVSNGGRVNLINSTISGNTASTSGGGLNIYNGGFSIQNSSIVNNAAAINNQYSIGGAGINFFGTANSTLQIINSTISGNSTKSAGGGVRLRDFNGTFAINNSTLTNNSSYLGGGGINRSGSGSGAIGLQSSIISGNQGGTNIVASGTINGSYSAVGPSSGFYLFGAGNLPAGTNLKLATLSAVPNSIQFVHLPAGDSPVLNAGSNTQNLTTDQRGLGFPRVLNGTPDIGAVEVPIVLSTVVTNANDSGTGSLRQAILNANSNAGADTVSFDPAFFSTPRTIALGGTEMILTDTGGATTITGPGASLLTISGSNLSRVFLVNAGVSAALSGVTITSGRSSAGGAVQNSGTLSISTSRFTANQAKYGGAIYSDATLSLADCTFDNNANDVADGFGGAIISGPALTVVRSTFTANSSTLLGGAICVTNANIVDSTFANNTSALNGGAIRSAGTITIAGSTFSGNSAANDGGAIMSHGDTTITNSTLAGNTASIGGGIYFFEGSGTLRNDTVAYNKATNTTGSFGAGTHVGTASVTAVNTIVAGNNGPNAAGAAFTGSSSNNLLNVSAAATGLGALASNGGLTQTIALSPLSPAINAGTASGTPTTDQRGLPRAGAPDVGAYELQAINNVLGIVVNDGATQRSRLTKVQVVFANPVDAATLGSITFTRTSGGTVGTVVFAGSGLIVSPASGMVSSITLTFANVNNADVNYGSLADGRWQLGIGSLNYLSTLGDVALRRFFGDANNDGTVNAQDFADFGNVFGATVSDSAFDFNTDGTINAQDLAEFGNRFGLTL